MKYSPYKTLDALTLLSHSTQSSSLLHFLRNSLLFFMFRCFLVTKNCIAFVALLGVIVQGV